MKKKELMKRMSAVAMAAMMTVTMIPSNAFAVDIEFSDGRQDAIEVQADTDGEADAELSVQNEESADAENLTQVPSHTDGNAELSAPYPYF